MTGWRNKVCNQLFYVIWVVAAMTLVMSCRHWKIDAGLAQVNLLAVGNPVMNPKIMGLYKKIMSENKVEESHDKISLVNKLRNYLRLNLPTSKLWLMTKEEWVGQLLQQNARYLVLLKQLNVL